MRRIYINLAVWGAMLSGFFLVAPFAFAQSQHFVLLQQSDASVQNSYMGSSCTGPQSCSTFYNQVGTGFTGSTTGAYVTDEYTLSGSSAVLPTVLYLQGYSDSSYSTLQTRCAYVSSTTVAPVAGQFDQLNFDSGLSSGTNPCTFVSSYYYEVRISFASSSPSLTAHTYNGSLTAYQNSTWLWDQTDPTYPNFVPQYAIVADGFQITPTASSSGLFLSGAQSFCNASFGTTSAGIFGITTDIANGLCQVGGYLFVPTPDSLQQFTVLPSILEGHIPFSYAYDMVNSFNGLSASSTENMDSFSISDLGSFASSSPFASVIPSNIDILSTTTISKFYPDPIRESMLFLASSAIWFVLIVAIYYRVVPYKMNI